MNTNYTADQSIRRNIATDDATGLTKARESYGDSWCRRRGPGAFIVGPARKMDRYIQMMGQQHDVLEKIRLELVHRPGDEQVLDAVRDARRYALLILEKRGTATQDPSLYCKTLETLGHDILEASASQDVFTNGPELDNDLRRSFEELEKEAETIDYDVLTKDPDAGFIIDLLLRDMYRVGVEIEAALLHLGIALPTQRDNK